MKKKKKVVMEYLDSKGKIRKFTLSGKNLDNVEIYCRYRIYELLQMLATSNKIHIWKVEEKY